MNKTLLTLLFMGSLNGLFSQATVYRAFPDSNAFWSYRHWNVLNSTIHNQTRYGLKADTVISSVTYHKVFSLFDSTLTNPYSSYYAAIRQQNKKVYAVVGNNAKHLLYDFSVSVGDTIYYDYSLASNSPSSFKRVVSSIDSMKMRDKKYHKRFNLAAVGFNSLPDTVVEGMGSICWQGLFNPLINARCTCGDVYAVVCIKEYDTTYLANDPLCDHCFCTFLTGKQNFMREIQSEIYPNPLITEAVFTSNEDLTGASVTVFNSTGQIAGQFKSTDAHTIQLQRGNLPAGLYFIHVKQDDSVIGTKKLLIAD
ncbi:MAG TPA: T9SS type A sorting domain-containing protein [Bacteroidia bacterium]|jgi:hypothetical protein|nr:T9SS type A sorting domain-containing protein [Bacteroidia bacterium]